MYVYWGVDVGINSSSSSFSDEAIIIRIIMRINLLMRVLRIAVGWPQQSAARATGELY